MSLAAAGPPALAGAYAINLMDLASSIWRLLLIAGTAERPHDGALRSVARPLPRVDFALKALAAACCRNP
jgi:hypothetical protein